jgi:uncharacterized membrane protein
VDRSRPKYTISRGALIFELDGFTEYNEWGIRWGIEDMGLTLAVLGVLLPLSLWFFWTSLSRINSPIRKATLFALRVAAFILLTLVLLQPELEFRKTNSMRNSIAVLLDNSKSLSIKTFPEEKPRMDLVIDTLMAGQQTLENWREDFNLDFFLVSDHIQAIGKDDIAKHYRASAQGIATDFTKVFAELQKRYEGKSLQGVVLFSDGADLTQEVGQVDQQLVKVLAGFKGPVHALQTGTNEQFKDLAIEDLYAADFGFIQQPVNLSVTIDATSIGNKNIPLLLKEGDNVLVSKMLEVREGQKRYQVEMSFTPTSLGQRIYSLSLPIFSGESITSNNRWDFMVNVIRDRIRVLLLNGRPTWDARFLREVLINNPKVDLLSFFILRNLGDEVSAPTAELSLIPFPSNLLFSEYLDSFDLVIFQNFRFTPFIDKKNLDNIKDYVHGGGAFLMVGGDLSFQGGGYGRTAIEDILPVVLLGEDKTFLKKDFQAVIQEKFSNHPILRLEKDPVVNREIWQSLPILNGVNTGIKPMKGAQVLLNFVDGKKGGVSYPGMVAEKKGKGRSMILASDSSWNWNFRRVGDGGSGRYYQKFWNNVLAWLTGDPETRKLQIETDKEKYFEDERVLIKLKVLDDFYNPAPKQKLSLIIHQGKNMIRKKELVTDDKGHAVHEFLPGDQGFYSARVEWIREQGKLDEEVNFGVFSETAEFQRPLVNSDLMKKIAEITGGQHRILQAGSNLAGLPIENPEVKIQAKTKSLSLWDSWWSYGLILLFLFSDWYLRRKSGLS